MARQRETPFLIGLDRALEQFLNRSFILKGNITHSSDFGRLLRRREVDLIMDSCAITLDNLEQAEFSPILDMLEVHFLSRKRASRAIGSFGVLFIFDVQTWVGIFVVLIVFYGALTILKQPNAFLAVLSSQLRLPVRVKRSRTLELTMITSGLLLSSAFSSGLLSSLSTQRSHQIDSIEAALDALREPDTFLCVKDGANFVTDRDLLQSSNVFQMMAWKRSRSQLILSTPADCLEYSEMSDSVISLLQYLSTVPYKGRLLQNVEESVYTPPDVLLIGPGFPLRRNINVLLAAYWEMQVSMQMFKTRFFNEDMKELHQKIPETPRARALTLRDIILPLLMLFGSWFVGCISNIWAFCVMCRVLRKPRVLPELTQIRSNSWKFRAMVSYHEHIT